jgi:[ribosomal protein S5]-alanine N-acetyltransferase
MTLEDIDALLKIFSDPITMRFYSKPFDRAMTVAWVERNHQRYAQHGIGLWAMVCTRM